MLAKPDEIRMRVLLLLLSLCLSLAARAADAPAGHIGESCRQAAEQEAQAGRAPQFDLEIMLKSGYLLFVGTSDAGEGQRILYRCSKTDGDVLGYSVRLSLAGEAMARAAFAREREKLTARWGRPGSDSESLALPERIRLWRALGKVYSAFELVQWASAPGRVSSLTLLKLRSDPQWQVVTADQPPSGEGGATPAKNLLGQWPHALVVALSSAAIATALWITGFRRFRVVLAIATPLAAGAAARWLLPWSAEDALAGPGAALLVFGAYFAAGALATSLALSGVGHRAHRFPMPAATPRANARWLLLAGLLVLTGLVGWLGWQFAPGRDPGSPVEGPALKWWLCAAALLASTALTLWGSAGLPGVRAPEETVRRNAKREAALATTGVAAGAALLTFCVHLAVEFALGL